MAWFQRDHTGRPLRRFEREFVTALGTLLAALAAPQIAGDETALTAERSTCLIVLIPHRALGGISIVVWLFDNRAEVTWAQVAALDVSHDSLDLGISVAQCPIDPAKPDFVPLLESIQKQIHEPLTLRCYGDKGADVFVHNRRGQLQKIGRVGDPIGWSDVFRRAIPARETEIRLTDQELPPVTSPSGIEQWFDSGGRRG